MTSAAPRLATYADLVALPDDVRAEVVGGAIVVAPSPSAEHQATLSLVATDLIGLFQRGRGGPGGWWIIPDVDVSFGPHDILRPDLVGWRRERMAQFPRDRPIAQRPDWVCEILSPSTAARDRGPKRDIYRAAGVPWYWLIDIANRTISVLRLTSEGFVDHQTAGDEGSASLAPFDAVALDLAAMFPPPLPLT
jgi:Uma2 family endonuclease